LCRTTEQGECGAKASTDSKENRSAIFLAKKIPKEFSLVAVGGEF
jgi:hypothetical protein